MENIVNKINSIESELLNQSVSIKEFLSLLMKEFESEEDDGGIDTIKIDQIINNLNKIRLEIHDSIDEINNSSSKEYNKKLHYEQLMSIYNTTKQIEDLSN